MVGTLVYRKRTEASGRKRGGGRARCQILRVSSPREKPCHSLPSLFFSTSPFLHFPRSSGASIINPNVVWPWPWPLIPMRACDARIPEGQRLSLLAGSQKPSSLSPDILALPPSSQLDTSGRELESVPRARKSSSHRSAQGHLSRGFIARPRHLRRNSSSLSSRGSSPKNFQPSSRLFSSFPQSRPPLPLEKSNP